MLAGVRASFTIILAAAACGGGTSAPARETLTTLPGESAAPPPSPAAEPPPPKGIVAEQWDIAVDIPTAAFAANPPPATIDARPTYWQVQWIDTDHTDGRMFDVMAMYRKGDAASFAAELRAQLLTENPVCTEPAPATFIGRDGLRFGCQLGDAWGVWYFAYEEPCVWSAMITQRGDTLAAIEPLIAERLARITPLGGRSAPRCAMEQFRRVMAEQP